MIMKVKNIRDITEETRMVENLTTDIDCLNRNKIGTMLVFSVREQLDELGRPLERQTNRLQINA